MTGFTSLFDGETLDGWHAVPRTYDRVWPGGPLVREVYGHLPAGYEEQAAAHPAQWAVRDSAIEGSQDPAHPGYGHLALEGHDNDPTFGEARWGKGSRCRWRNIRIREID